MGAFLRVSIVCASLAMLTGTGCGHAASSSHTDGGTGDDDDPQGGTPEQDCLDAADVFAKAGVRCGGTYEQSYNGFIVSSAAGSCSNIIAIRDERALFATCLPWAKTAACAALSSDPNPACEKQLLRRAD